MPTSTRQDYYVPLPLRLIDDLCDSPLAIGVYALAARLFRATKAAVPLSPSDLRALDTSLSYGAATRALQRLAAAGYLSAMRSRGHKSVYTPTWGTVAGELRRWDLEASCLGRPRHLREVRLPQRLLDSCLGRLDPHPAQPARVTRYTTTALISLEDIGAYALALAGRPATSPTLASLGLLTAAGPQPLPDDVSILALASQRRLWDAGSPLALSPAGWARTPFAVSPAAPAETVPGQPLFFVPHDQIVRPIEPMIAQPISPSAAAQSRRMASQRPRGRAVPEAAGSHAEKYKQESDTTTHSGSRQSEQAGGGNRGLHHQATNSELALLRLGVRSEVARGLADRPLALVTRLIEQARARPGVRDNAAWVVSALRALPAEESPAATATKVSDMAILMHPGLSHHERTRWLTRFRNAQPADRPAILARFHDEHPSDTAGGSGLSLT